MSQFYADVPDNYYLWLAPTPVLESFSALQPRLRVARGNFGTKPDRDYS